MIYPTPEEIVATKVKALALSPLGSDRVLQIESTDPVTGFEACVLARPLGLPAWKEHVDIANHSAQQADSKVFADHVLWPSFEAAQALRQQQGTLAAQVRSEILGDAGFSHERVTISVLTGTNRPAWLSEDERVKLAAEHPRLYVASFPTDWTAILRPPLAEVFTAAQAARTSANAANIGIIDSTLTMASELVVRSVTPLDQALLKTPVLSSDMWQAMQLIGGMAAKVRSKSL